MNSICIEKLDSAINVLCPEIWRNMESTLEADLSEEALWEELVCCVLSSQVKFELSQAVTANLKQNGLLELNAFDTTFEEQLGKLLRHPVKVDGRSVRYRFPNIKAKQIAAAQSNIYGKGGSLNELMNKYSDTSELRIHLVDLVPGLGMKQASMYLRNVSNSFELAVIDSHVLKYMNISDLIMKVPSTISNAQYLVKESKLASYTEKFGFPVGCVDYAIWIVMRVASKGGYI